MHEKDMVLIIAFQTYLEDGKWRSLDELAALPGMPSVGTIRNAIKEDFDVQRRPIPRSCRATKEYAPSRAYLRARIRGQAEVTRKFLGTKPPYHADGPREDRGLRIGSGVTFADIRVKGEPLDDPLRSAVCCYAYGGMGSTYLELATEARVLEKLLKA